MTPTATVQLAQFKQDPSEAGRIQALAITQSQHTEELATHTELLRSAHTKLDLLVTMLGRLSGEPDDE